MQHQNPQNLVSSLQIIFFALLAGQVLFLGVVFFLVQQDTLALHQEDTAEVANVLKIIVPILAVGGLLGGNLIFKNLIKTARTKDTLQHKLADYRTAFIIRAALLEAPVLLGVVAYMLSEDITFAIIAVVLIALFVLMRPTPSGISSDLQLSTEEQEGL